MKSALTGFHSERGARHPVVARIVNAYEARKAEQNAKRRWRQSVA